MDPQVSLPPDVLDVPLASISSLVTIFGIEGSRVAWAWGILFVAYFVGVAIGILLRMNGSTRWYQAIAASIPVSLFALPVSAHTLFGQARPGEPNLLDQIADTLGSRQMSGEQSSMLWLGVVMVAGIVAPRVLRFIAGFASALPAAMAQGWNAARN
jgi:hypothetical protein